MENEISQDKNINTKENLSSAKSNNNIDDGDDKEAFLSFFGFAKILIISLITSILIISFLFDTYDVIAVLLTAILVVIKTGLVLAYKSIVRAR